jgi:hypothetical protein
VFCEFYLKNLELCNNFLNFFVIAERIEECIRRSYFGCPGTARGDETKKVQNFLKQQEIHFLGFHH